MDAATLRVLVQVNGVRRATRELRELDTEGARAARTARQAGGDFDSAGRSTGGFAGELRKARAAAVSATSSLHKAGRAARDAGSGGRDGGNGFRRLATAMGDLPGRIYLSTRLLGALMNVLLTMAPVLVGLAAQFVAVASAMGPLVGLAAAVGGAMVAAAQGFGVFKLATMGLGDALKEQMKNQDRAGVAAVRNGAAQRNAASAVQAAQEGVRNATRAVTEAQRDHERAVAELGPAYTSARRGLVDMRAEAQSAVRSVAAMSLGLQDARKALADLIRGPSPLDLADAQDRVADATRGSERALLNLSDAQKALNAVLVDESSTADDVAKARLNLRDAENAVGDSQRDALRAAQELAELEKPASARDLAGARLTVAQAEASLTEARRMALRHQKDLNAAEAAGVSGSSEVIAARQAITAAEDRLREARRSVGRAQQGVRDAQLSANEALTTGAAAAAKLNEKMSDLPPVAQAFVRQLVAMKPRLDALRDTAARGFFPGATAGLRAAARSFGSVNRVVGETSTVLGDAARKSGQLVGSPAFGRDIEIIGGRNAKVIDTLGEALRHVISAMRHVLVAAGPLTQWLADVANKWALNAAASAKAGRETGRLAAFFERTRETAQRLGSILGNLASGFLGIGRASSATGRSILVSLDRLTERFAVWANSVRGRNEIADFMNRANKAMKELGPGLAALIAAFTTFSMIVLPVYGTILRTLEPVMDEIITLFIAWKIAATAAAIATGILRKAVVAYSAAQWLLNAALAANPIGLVIVALVALGAALVVAYKHSEGFRKVVDGVWSWLKTATTAVFGSVNATITTTWRNVSSVTSTVWNAIRSTLSSAWSALRSSATSSWNGIGLAILTPARFARDQLGVIATGISNRLGAAWASIQAATSAAWIAVRDLILTPLRTARDLIPGIVEGMANRVAAGWRVITGGARDFAGGVKDTIVDAFKGAANAVLGFVRSIINVINKIPGVDIDTKALKLAEGGTFGGGPNGNGRLATQGFAHGGAFARTGGMVKHPMTLMGEEAPRHPEFVIPTNPAYRGRAQMLLVQAASAVGLAEGGVIDAFRGAIKQSDAGPKPSLALWMAGIVESGLRNLPYGDRDSLGALQVRAGIHGRDLAMDPRRSALAFLNRGFTGRGGAIALSNVLGSAGQVAQAVQGSAFPDRYDAVREQAMKYMKGGGGGGGIGGLLGKISGVVGDLLSKGAGFLLDKLPGVGDLPDWLKGMGTHVLGKVGAWIKDQVSGLVSSGGGQGGAGVMTGTNAKAAKLAQMFNATITSGYRDPARNAAVGGAPGSSHMKGSPANPGAHDFVPASNALLNAALKMGAKWVDNHDYGSGLHSHVSWFRKGGMYGPVMGSYAQGTNYVPQTGPYLLHRGESVTPAGRPTELRIDSLHVYVGDREITDIVRVEIEQDGRRSHAEFMAGTA